MEQDPEDVDQRVMHLAQLRQLGSPGDAEDHEVDLPVIDATGIARDVERLRPTAEPAAEDDE